MSILSQDELTALSDQVNLTKEQLSQLLTKSVVSQEELEKLSAVHQAIRDYKQKQQFYQAYVYPALRESFKRQKTADDPQIEVLLLPISNPHLPVLAAARWEPKVAIGLYSSFSKKFRQTIEAEIKALGLAIECKGEEILNIEIEPDRLYAAIKEVIEPYLRSATHNPHIAVDITGGTKVMSVASAMAVSEGSASFASFVGGRFFYIQSGTTRDDIQKRIVGTEQAKPLDDPYAVFGDIERERAKALYRQHDYTGAARIYESLAEHVTPSQGDEQWAVLAKAYAAWDAFDLEEASKLMNRLLWPSSDAATVLQKHQKVLKQQALILSHLATIATRIEKGPPLNILKEIDSVLDLLGSLYHNALRREATGRYDMAALLLYRCLELISQRRLATYGIATDNPRYHHRNIRYRTLSRRYEQALRKHFPRSRHIQLPHHNITLFNGYVILEALRDALVTHALVSRIKIRTKTRNQSILAHGFRLITKDEYNQFKLLVDDLLKRFFQIERCNQKRWSGQHQFIAV